MNDNINDNINDNSNINNNNNITSSGNFSYEDNDFYYQFAPKPESELLKKFKQEFPFFSLITIAYALFYTFCLYKNPNGITAPLYVAGAITYFGLCLKRLGVSFTRDIIFYIITIVLLGINLCVTNDTCLIVFDHIGIWLIVGAGLIHLFFKDDKWGLGKYIASLAATGVIGFGEGFMVFSDVLLWSKNRSKDKDSTGIKTLGLVLIGIVIAFPILCIVTILLASADSFFGNFIESTVGEFFENLFEFENFGAIFMFGLIALISYGIIRFLCEKSLKEEVAENRKFTPVIAITVNLLIGFLYVIFSGFQIFYLFLGKMTLPEDYSFAEYAREGFFQLVVVCLINMVLVLICLYLFENTKVLKATLLIISLCTYIMIASSTLRMIMYVQVYQLSYTRVFVFFALLIIFMVMNGISVYIFRKDFPLFRYSMVVTAVLYIIFAYSNPCGMIAKNNLSERYCGKDGNYSEIDFNYINEHLGYDAATQIIDAVERENNPEFSEKFENYFEMENNDSFRQFNFVRHSYSKALSTYNKKYNN